MSSGETWVLNETVSFDLPRVNVDFTSNNENFDSIIAVDLGKFEKNLTYNRADGGAVIVFDAGIDGLSWKDQAYRTLIFAIPPTGDLLTWLQSNAVKQ